MTHLYLIRHAENIDGLDDSGDGRKHDLGLSPEGIVQAEKLRDRLARTGEIKPDVFISSPERRAHETAKIIAPAIDVPIVLDKDVEEWRSDDGSMSTEAFMGLWNETSDREKPYLRWMDGHETMLEFSTRVKMTMNRILQAHDGKKILLLSHGAFIQTTFEYFFGYGLSTFTWASPEIRRTSITHWVKDMHRQRWVLERSNDYHHLLE